MITMFDDGPLDLVQIADANQLDYLMGRYRNSPYGMRLARLRTLRRTVLQQLQRTQQEKPQ